MSADGLITLLDRAPAVHRAVVAAELDIEGDGSPAEIAAALRDPARIAAVVGGLSASARRLAAQAAFTGETVVLQSWGGRPVGLGVELERYGLAYAFKRSYVLAYVIPRELHRRLADAVAAPYAARLAKAAAARFIEAPVQIAHDVAQLWAYLARTPVRVKTDGALYQREVPKLLGALPPVEFHDRDQGLAESRLEFALSVLADEGLVSVRVNDRPGGDGRRELVAAGDPGALLGAPPESLRERLLGHACVAPLGGPGVALASALKPGAAISLTSFGAALRALCHDNGIEPPDGRDAVLALAGLHFAWLAGAVSLGVDRGGMVVAVRAMPRPGADAGRVICQGNFELVALSPLTPSQRLTLALMCETIPEQPHVFRLTRRSVQGAQRSGALAGGVSGALERLVGELPQNVARSVAAWAASVRAPLRLRTAMVLDTGDTDTAEALLAGELRAYVVERVGPSQLAIKVQDVRAVEAALRRAGHQLEPGVDRVSGRWADGDRDHGPTDAQHVWERETADGLYGTQVSTLETVAKQLSLTSPVPPNRAAAAAAV